MFIFFMILYKGEDSNSFCNFRSYYLDIGNYGYTIFLKKNDKNILILIYKK